MLQPGRCAWPPRPGHDLQSWTTVSDRATTGDEAATERSPRPLRSCAAAAGVLRRAARLYVHNFGRLFLLAVVVFGPLAVLDDVLTVLLREATEDAGLGLRIAAFTLTIINISIAVAGLTFFAGAIELLVGATERGEPSLGLRRTAALLPWRLFIAVNLVSVLLSALGDALFVIPGLIVFTLLAIAGPLAIIERRGVIATLRRSAALVRRRFWLVAVLVTLPAVLEEGLGDALLESGWLTSVTPKAIADIALAVLLGSAIGVTEAVMARFLLEEERPRRLERAPDQAARAGKGAGCFHSRARV